jgi:hypothetical protein
MVVCWLGQHAVELVIDEEETREVVFANFAFEVVVVEELDERCGFAKYFV